MVKSKDSPVMPVIVLHWHQLAVAMFRTARTSMPTNFIVTSTTKSLLFVLRQLMPLSNQSWQLPVNSASFNLWLWMMWCARPQQYSQPIVDCITQSRRRSTSLLHCSLNCSLNSGLVSDVYKVTYITPLLKNSDRSVRGIRAIEAACGVTAAFTSSRIRCVSMTSVG